MIIGPDYVFIAVPRTASMSIAAWLMAKHGGIWHGDHHGTDIPSEHRDKFTFTVVRNPFTRLPSLHHYVAETFWANDAWRESEEAAAWRSLGMPLDSDLVTFVDWAATQAGHRWCSQSLMLAGVRFDMVLRFEWVTEPISRLSFAMNGAGLPYPVKQQSLVLPTAERDAILAHSREDFERFGYNIT